MVGPGIPAGARVDSLSEHVDIPETIMEVLGFQAPEEWVWHGSSLLPLIDGTERRAAVFADGGHEEAMRKRFETPAWQEEGGKRVKAAGGKQLTYQEEPDSMARCKMVRTDTWKLVVRQVGGNELFNMVDDPQEMNNLYDEDTYKDVIFDLQKMLLDWCMATDTDRPFLKKFGA